MSVNGITTKGGREEEADLTPFLGMMPTRRRLEIKVLKTATVSVLGKKGDHFKTVTVSVLGKEGNRIKTATVAVLVFSLVAGWLTFMGFEPCFAGVYFVIMCPASVRDQERISQLSGLACRLTSPRDSRCIKCC